jgi:hypothetical protein
LGNGFNTFAPLGPAIVTKDEVPDPHSLNIKLTIGGKLLQHSNTRELIFRIPDLITYTSSSLLCNQVTSSARELLQEWAWAYTSSSAAVGRDRHHRD